MNNIDELLFEVKRMLNEEETKRDEALNEQALAEEMKAAAIKKEKASKATIRELEIAKNHAEKAQEAYNATRENNNRETVVVETKEEEKVIVENNNGKSSKGFVTGLVAGVAAVALLAGGYKLIKESKTGDVKLAASSPIQATETVKDEPEQTVEPVNYSYNYDNNAVVVAENTESEYVALTTERFEDLASETINTLNNTYGLSVSKEDIIKYVMIRNIDKLRQDNNELVSEVIGDQDPIEVFADADHVIDAIMTYNLLYFDANHNTDGFISASIGVFDETQKSRVLEVENRVYEIGKYYQDEEKYNELTYSLLRDMIDPTKGMSELEDGASYGLIWIDMYMVRSTFGTDRYIKLNDTNADLVKYYISFAGDGYEYETNALVNGNTKNINALLTECKDKTLTK